MSVDARSSHVHGYAEEPAVVPGRFPTCVRLPPSIHTLCMLASEYGTPLATSMEKGVRLNPVPEAGTSANEAPLVFWNVLSQRKRVKSSRSSALDGAGEINKLGLEVEMKKRPRQPSDFTNQLSALGAPSTIFGCQKHLVDLCLTTACVDATSISLPFLSPLGFSVQRNKQEQPTAGEKK